METVFEIRHKSGALATATNQGNEFVVAEGSQARRDAGHASSGNHSYAELKRDLIANGTLEPTPDSKLYRFARAFAFRSPSAAAAVILDRSSNGRVE